MQAPEDDTWISRQENEDAEEETKPAQLASVSEKQLTAKCKPDILTYCPTMDLVALATEDEQVHVFRLNGQKVFGGFARGGGEGLKVKALKWKANGHLLAVGTSDNNVRILSAYSGKTVHVLACKPAPAYGPGVSPRDPGSKLSASICCLGWGVNLTDSKTAARTVEDSQGRVTVEDMLAPETPLSKIPYIKADLPRELALLDIDRSLPKLSTLPSTGDDDDIFSSRASIDSVFHSGNKNSDSVDVLLVGFNDGTIHIRIFDSFEIGSINVRKSFDNSADARALVHASHPMSSTHAFLFATNPRESERLWIFSLDLLFITKSGRYLSVLASKVTQLQNLLRYIKQVQTQIHLEWKNAQDLPGRYLRNINEDLQEKLMCDFVTAAYHLAVTGDCFEPLKEFLVDQVGERGHKRWEKAVLGGYETTRRLIHECLLPALERCSVLLSRLIGLSKFHKLSPVLGLDTTDLKECLATIDCLTLLGHKVMVNSGHELVQFFAFSRWLRYEIDLQGADPLSSTAEELMEKADAIDHAQTLSYIQGALTRSALLDFIQPRTLEPGNNRWRSVDEGGVFYEIYKKILQKLDKRKAGEVVEAPMLSDLTDRLSVQFERVFRRIAETQRRSILERSILSLGKDFGQETVDMTMNYWNDEGTPAVSVFAAARSKTCPFILYLERAVLTTINGVSSTETLLTATISLRQGTIMDVKFVEDGTIMLLWSDGNIPGAKYLIHFPYQPDKDPLFSPKYVKDGNSDQPPPSDQITHLDIFDPRSHHVTFVRHTFPQDKNRDPLRIEVNGRPGRRVVCALYSDRQWYSVFDIDSMDDRDDEEKDASGEEEMGENFDEQADEQRDDIMSG
ncbi:hypothetical protein D8B26_005595 [Coccidioides posadasii str. Silveira]|uniref:Anaphase-promoting complex component Cut20/Apc4 n=1 Tax=Coccidioides posadasii (strain RMSCC 757 / Silveira) TaxID=443226 RepID=E9D3Z0_COCPS|nr:anaphase-promoting complex component Cut20/Apc4 [Coccidioides posadasii str. Silveira]QVM10944.1 hypothetical protein D8B26_005595 [Coccidioides posadasii str. Silveira]